MGLPPTWMGGVGCSVQTLLTHAAAGLTLVLPAVPGSLLAGIQKGSSPVQIQGQPFAAETPDHRGHSVCAVDWGLEPWSLDH